MYMDFGRAVSRFLTIHAALGCAPSIRPDFTKLSRDDLPIVLLSLMNRGLRTFPELFKYLDEHDAPFDEEDVISVLDDHVTTTQFDDLTVDGLWHADEEGLLTPDIGAPL